MKVLLGILAFILLVVGMIGISYGVGWIGVHQTATIGKAQQNAERKVFEQSQSHVDGKRQMALKYYREWKNADIEDRKAIEEIVSLEFANFDISKLDGKLYSFVNRCMFR